MLKCILLVFLISVASVSDSFAGTIVLSGDANIGNPIDGSTTSYVDPNNALFFRNILGTGTRVRIHSESSDPSIVTSTSAMNNFYNSLSGVMSTLDLSGSAITNSLLAGVDLFIIHPSDPFNPSEVAAFSTFLTGPGTLFFLAENQWDFFDANDAINSVLTSLGSSLRVANNTMGYGFNTSVNLNNVDPLISGLSQFTYGTHNSLTGGIQLVGSFDVNVPVVAYERLTISAIPEPSSFLVWSFGLSLFTFMPRRR